MIICYRALENRKHGLVSPGSFYPPLPVSKLLLASLGIRQGIKVGRRLERKDNVFLNDPSQAAFLDSCENKLFFFCQMVITA